MWNEPARGGMPDPSYYSLPGMEQAQILLRGGIPNPPISRLMGITLTQVGPGTATGTQVATPWLDNGDDTLDVNILLQESLTMAVVTSAPPGSEVLPATLTVNHLRPCLMEGKSFVVRARVVHSGPRFTSSDILMEDSVGRVVAHATGTHLVRPLDPPPPTPTRPFTYEHPQYETPDPYLRPRDDAHTFVPAFEEHGPDAMRLILDGDVPPAASQELLGWRFVEAGPGRIGIAMPTSDWLRNRPPGVAAGAIAFTGSMALSGTLYTVAASGHRIGILEYNVTYLRPVPVDGRDMVARAEIVREAGDLFVTEGDVTDADGNVVARGRQTCLMIKKRTRPTRAAAPERVLATVLFTDIVGSTRKAEELGDAAWRELLEQHHAVVRQELRTWKGKEVKTLGDGFLATFDSPTRAVQCARAIRDQLVRLGLEIRAGLHTGECDVSPGDVGGLAVHVAARIEAAAQPGEVLVSATVRDLAAGSGLRFNDRGRHELKGIEGDWALYALAG